MIQNRFPVFFNTFCYGNVTGQVAIQSLKNTLGTVKKNQQNDCKNKNYRSISFLYAAKERNVIRQETDLPWRTWGRPSVLPLVFRQRSANSRCAFFPFRIFNCAKCVRQNYFSLLQTDESSSHQTERKRKKKKSLKYSRQVTENVCCWHKSNELTADWHNRLGISTCFSFLND